jgi:hypothetical protein
MEHVLQVVIGSNMMSMLNSFLRYNQVEIAKNGRYKNDFTSLWGTHAYIHMPFGLVNVGATFQRAMDFAFLDYLFKFIVVYQTTSPFFLKIEMTMSLT